MLKEKEEPLKEVKKKIITKDYTVLKSVTLEKLYNTGSTISVEVGSKIEKYLLINKFVNKHGISRSN